MSFILRPSPNETARILQDEKQRRRQTRILQVREQEKMVAIRIRRAMQERREKEVKNLANILQKQHNKKRQDTLKISEEKFTKCLKDVGSAHESAKENAPNQALLDAIADENQKTASDRGKIALQNQKIIRGMQEEESIEKRRKRHVALIKEKVRAKHIANLPSPFPNPADTYLDATTTTDTTATRSSGSIPHHPGRYATIQVVDHESTMTTTVSLGLPSNAVVERATTAEAATDAREEAQKEGERIDLLQAERDRAVQECMEKAKVRHLAALEQARLGRESKALMSDLKKLTMKDALRRQHHIEYKWDDNVSAKRACQDLFGAPGSRFHESELFSRNLQKTQDDEIPSCLEESTNKLTLDSQDGTTGWSRIPGEEGEKKPTRVGALNRLLKQIESQRQQRKNGQEAGESSSQGGGTTENTTTSKEDSEEVSVESLEEESNHPRNETDPFHAMAPQQSVASVPSKRGTNLMPQATSPPELVQEESSIRGMAPFHSVASLPEHGTDLIARATSPPKSTKLLQENAPKLSPERASSLTQDPSGTNDLVKSRSESLLENSLQSMRNDEALLRSVKNFQERLLQQHKSCAKIEEQIQRLEQKKAAIDGMVTDVTKPKFF